MGLEIFEEPQRILSNCKLPICFMFKNCTEVPWFTKPFLPGLWTLCSSTNTTPSVFFSLQSSWVAPHNHACDTFLHLLVGVRSSSFQNCWLRWFKCSTTSLCYKESQLFIFWTPLSLSSSLQDFFPLRYQYEQKPKKRIKQWQKE